MHWLCGDQDKYKDGYKFIFNSKNPPQNKQFPSNYISTSRYNIFTFLPLSLFLQFKRLANIYFLLIAILQSISQISPLEPYTAWVPLIIVIGVSIIRQGIEDYFRHKSDNQLNNNPCIIWDHNTLSWINGNWNQLRVGNFVKIQEGEFFPADLILFNSSLDNGLCYIQTAALDGQKNLKPKSAIEDILYYKLQKGVQGSCIAMPPNTQLYKFYSQLDINNNKINIPNAKSLLLRGAKLKNTKWIIGMVVYAGELSKIMKNSPDSTFKLSHIQQNVNYLLLFILAFQIGISILCAIGNKVFYQLFFLQNKWYIAPAFNTNFIDSLLRFFTYIVLLNTMIPISLIVSIEIVKVVQTLIMNRDIFMYNKQKKKGLNVFSSSLNQQLGQIEYIFSDKTGTLTCNVMQFKACILGKDLYGDKSVLNHERKRTELKYSFQDPQLEQIMFQNNTKFITSVSLKNKNNITQLEFKTIKDIANQFFFALGIAHECIVERNQKTGKNQYQGPSPDQITLVEAARRMQFQFIKSSSAKLYISINGKQQEIEVLEIFPFDSDRKRMSIVVRVKNQIRMYIKGADSIIIKRLTQDSPFLETINNYLTKFSRIGLRTLLIGMRIIQQEQYRQFKHKVSLIPNNQKRDEQMQKVISQLQKQIFLLGATAVQDKLQPNLQETIADLIRADIKIWMLTGDKMETAESIAKSCNLIQNQFLMLKYKNEQRKNINEYLDQLIKQLVQCRQQKKSILIQGQDLGMIINDIVSKQQLVQIALICDVVVCCRVTPKQKAQVVQLVKQRLNKITLSIGDGSNDVNMIKEADIGVGLYGQEGMGAVQASDYALPQFQYLWRLLLVHGRWNYLRISQMVLYFFYKNMVFSIPQFYFAFFCAFSGQTIFIDLYITLFNLIFTSLPVIFKAFLQQDIYYILKNDKSKGEKYLPQGFIENKKIKRMYPQFYYIGQRNTIFNFRNFFIWLFQGFIDGLIIALVSIYSLNSNANNIKGYNADYYLISITIYSTVIIIVTFRLATHTRLWNWLFFIITFISGVILYISWIFISGQITTADSVIIQMFRTPQSYFIVIFCCCLIIGYDSITLYIRDRLQNKRIGVVRKIAQYNHQFIQHLPTHLDTENASVYN